MFNDHICFTHLGAESVFMEVQRRSPEGSQQLCHETTARTKQSRVTKRRKQGKDDENFVYTNKILNTRVQVFNKKVVLFTLFPDYPRFYLLTSSC